MSLISFQKTENCIKEIEEILSDISTKLQDSIVLDRHEELNRILFSRVIVQFTQEFNDNAEIVWNHILDKNKNLQGYNDTKKLLFNEYIGFADLVVMTHGISKYNDIIESDDYRTCKNFIKSRHFVSHPTNKNHNKLIRKFNDPESKHSLKDFQEQKILEKSKTLFEEIISL